MAASTILRKRLAAISRAHQADLAIGRLARLLTLEREYGHQLNEAGQRLLRTSTFSAYCDCRALGLTRRAQSMLTDRSPDPSPALAIEIPAAVEIAS